MSYKDANEQRKYQRNWRAARRSVWMEMHGPCNKCGSHEDLEVDHVDPTTKSMPIGSIWSRVDRGEELEKCQVLCKACHLTKTRAERHVDRTCDEDGCNKRHRARGMCNAHYERIRRGGGRFRQLVNA